MRKSNTKRKSNGATIADVAEAAGVSPMTVSRVLNHSGQVSGPTRARVETAIESLNFSPDPSARGLRRGRSLILGLVYDNPNAEYVAEMQLGVLDATRASGYELIAHPCDFRSPDLAADILGFVSRLKVDGVILLPPVSERQDVADELTEQDVEIVRVASTRLDAGSQFVVSNDRQAASDMVRHLIEQGHRDIGFVCGPLDFRSAQERLEGFKDEMRRQGLPIATEYILEGGYTFESGFECGSALLELSKPPTVVFASNDEMAAGVIKAAHEKGLDVPEALSVAGFDDSPIAARLWPSLTTVRQPVREMGRQAAEILLLDVDGDASSEPIGEANTPSVVMRDSTCAPQRKKLPVHTPTGDLGDEDFLFPADPVIRGLAKDLYESIRELPIISPHGHTDPRWFARNDAFSDATSLFLTPDHYLLRMLHSNGVGLAELGVGRANDDTFDARAAWRTLANKFYLFKGTPSGLWTERVLATVFGIDTPLSAVTADEIFDRVGERLQTPAFRPRALFEQFGLEFLATTESAVDELKYHKELAADSWQGRVVTTYRPDSVTDPENEAFDEALSRFAEITGEDTQTWAGYLRAHRLRREEFKQLGATATDHGHPTAKTADMSEAEAQALFDRIVGGERSPELCEQFRAQMLTEMAKMSIDDRLVMQIHPGVYRNHSASAFEEFGRDIGADIPLRTDYVSALKPLLDRFGCSESLKLIVFTVDETTYSRELAPLAGFYPALKLGPAWWFHDSPAGIMRFREQTTETAGFYNTVGFNDDTRAFMSIPVRHDVARRVDSVYLARLVSEHRLGLNSALEIAYDLTYALPKRAYNIL